MILTTSQLIAHLEHIIASVKEGDSLEGNIVYTAHGGDDAWDVEGAYRIGNLMGQGGMVLLPETPKCPECHGSGRTDNHVTGEVECGSCQGTGVVEEGATADAGATPPDKPQSESAPDRSSSLVASAAKHRSGKR